MYAIKKGILFALIAGFISCNQSREENKKNDVSNKATIASNEYSKDSIKQEYIDIKSLFNLSPLSIFDDTTSGLEQQEKEDLLSKDESETWKITEQSDVKLKIVCKYPSSEVTFYFLKNKDSLDGVLCAQIQNEQLLGLRTWSYSSKDNTLQEVDILKEYTADDFVSKEDKFPDTYTSSIYYLFIDNQTIEVTPHTWMENEFINRDVVYEIFLKWNGKEFEEIIKKIGEYKR